MNPTGYMQFFLAMVTATRLPLPVQSQRGNQQGHAIYAQVHLGCVPYWYASP
jgi:hypothetical protein